MPLNLEKFRKVKKLQFLLPSENLYCFEAVSMRFWRWNSIPSALFFIVQSSRPDVKSQSASSTSSNHIFRWVWVFKKVKMPPLDLKPADVWKWNILQFFTLILSATNVTKAKPKFSIFRKNLISFPDAIAASVLIWNFCPSIGPRIGTCLFSGTSCQFAYSEKILC